MTGLSNHVLSLRAISPLLSVLDALPISMDLLVGFRAKIRAIDLSIGVKVMRAIALNHTVSRSGRTSTSEKG